MVQGRFASTYRKLANTKQQPKEVVKEEVVKEDEDEEIQEEVEYALTAEDLERLKAQEAQQRKIALMRARAKLSKALHDQHVEDAVEAVELMLDEEEPVPSEHLAALLRCAAQTPDAERFARAVSAAQRGKVTLDEQTFAALVGTLLANEAPHALVRCVLNFGLPPDGHFIPLIPYEIRPEEIQDVFRAATNDDSGELDLDLRAETDVPPMLEFAGCRFKPDLNGLYQRQLGRKDLLGHERPIYQKQMGFSRRYRCYYWDAALTPDETARDKESGWYIASEIGGGHTFARCVGTSEGNVPPKQGWSFTDSKENWIREASSGFIPPTSRTERIQALNLTEEESKTALEGVDLDALRGSVQGRDPEVCKYFCHFFILLCLELMSEIQNFRSRWRFRSLDQLVKFGIAFKDIKAEYEGKVKESKQAPLPGWPSLDTVQVHFSLPRDLKEENCRFKPGENVVISINNPVQNRVAEAMVHDVDLWGHVLVLNVRGQMPEDPWRKKRYRIDSYANRIAFERQANALLQFTMERTTVCEMLVSGGVGRIDEIVKDDAALMRRRQLRDRLGPDYKGEQQAKLAKMDKDTKAKIKADALAMWDEEDFFDEEEGAKDELEDIDITGISDVKEEKLSPEEEEQRKKTIELASQVVGEVNEDNLMTATIQANALPNTSDAQKNAIVNAMSKRLTIIQGPPGTGKTHTSVRILSSWVKTMGYKPLLATSECNVAVDNIAEGLVANGIKVVRIGKGEKISQRLEEAILDNLVRCGREQLKEEGREMYDDDDVIEDLGEEPEDRRSPEWEAWSANKARRAQRRAWESQQVRFMQQKILDEAEVICATTIHCGSVKLSGFNFHGVLIDEVAQATETSCIVPVVFRGAQQLVLCGDHCQLPPSVLSREAELRGFTLSLYSRMTMTGVPFCFLDTQYRAHPMLMEFSATCIYDGRLKNGVDASKRPRPNGLPWPGLESPAMFLESNVEEHLEGESKANYAEAVKVKELVRGLLDRGAVGLEDIGVVTPYKGQVRVLRKMLHEQNGLNVEQEQAQKLEIASVDNFQGREKEVIIFSAVRCNTFGSVGFLKDWRRLNVMVTRARRALVVIGNAMTLCKDDYWKKWLQTTEKQGGCRKGTVKKALEDGENFEGILPCEENMDFFPSLSLTDFPAPPRSKRNWSDMNSDDEDQTATTSPVKVEKKPKVKTEDEAMPAVEQDSSWTGGSWGSKWTQDSKSWNSKWANEKWSNGAEESWSPSKWSSKEKSWNTWSTWDANSWNSPQKNSWQRDSWNSAGQKTADRNARGDWDLSTVRDGQWPSVNRMLSLQHCI